MSHTARLKRPASVALRPLIFGLLLLPALLPLLRGNVLPCTHDNIFHGYRIVAMRDMLRHGWLFSRWVPNLALGYGYPFFNYREPLPYLTGEALYILGFPLPLVLGLLYAGSLVGASWGAYVLARDLFGERAGWVAGIAYGLSPYLLMDALRRGNMPESVGLALVPWLFVTTRRLIIRKSRADFTTTVLLLVALFLSHNISSLLLAPYLGAYVVLLAWVHRDRRGWPYAFAAVGLAVLLTAWFWLPALAEQDFVQLHLSRTTRNNDFRYNFVTWGEMLLSLPVPYDPSYLNPPMRIVVGVGQVVLGATGAVLGLTRRRGTGNRALVALFILAAVGYLWMASPGATGLWERLEILSFVQFPWRLVGRALLPISLLAGLAVEVTLTWFATLTRAASGLSATKRGAGGWPSTATMSAVVAVLVLLAWPDTYPPKGMCPSTPYPTMHDLYTQESAGWLGMDPESSYFPIWVEDHPQELALATAFADGVLPERFDVSALPDGGAVLSAAYRPLTARLVVSAPVSYTARWLGLYFPGWSVRVDGAIVPVSPEPDTGLLTFEVPAGNHELEVRFGMTPARRVGAILATAGALLSAGFLVVVSRWLRPKHGRTPGRDAREAEPAVSLTPRPALALVILAVTLAGIRIAVVDRIETPVRRSRLAQGELPEGMVPLSEDYAGGLRLLGAAQGALSLAADEELAVNLLWQARQQVNIDYRITVLLKGTDGQVWSPAGTARPRGYEPPITTRGWVPGQYAYDPHLVTLLPGAPPGDYEVVVTVFDADTLAPDSILGIEGRPAAPNLVLGTVRVTAPETVPSHETLEVPVDSRVAACGSLGLWAMTADRSTSAPGDIVAIRWVWEALATPSSDVEATLVMLSPEGKVGRSWFLPPSTAWWPTGRWSEGERWVGRHVVRLPGDLDSGLYRLAVSLPGCAPLAEVKLLVEAPMRTWMISPDHTPTSISFADQAHTGDVSIIELAGVDLPNRGVTAGQRLEVGLAWRALIPLDVSYRVYLHLLDGEGALVDQDDGEPAAWTRPTTGWAAGEVVTEVRHVTLPESAAPGDYILRVGLYEGSGSRLLTAEGDDGAFLTIVTVR